ncbi:MAG: BCAM0308 family protein [Desulfuromonadaceae bacterium]|nr:BCAM0308 family protein [Desulfuromonadaceae bacterium]
MVTTMRRTEEKGQRTPRSMDVYQEKGGVKGVAYCACGAEFRNKRWYCGDSGTVQNEGHELVCPACHRIADHNPAGIVSLSGEFLADHESEIHNLINNTAQTSVLRNPLGRVMDICNDTGGITITTTDVKLAQKIGREVFKSYGGQLQYTWTHAESPVRVTWSR